MDRLEVFRFHQIGRDTLFSIQAGSNITNHILDKFGIVVGVFGHVLLIRTFEQGKQLAGGLRLDHLDDFLDPDVLKQAGRDGHV